MSTSHPPAEDPPSPSHHLNLPNDDDDDAQHDDKYPHSHSDHNTPTQDAIIDVLAHLHPQPQSNDDVSEPDAGYHSFSHPPDLTSSQQEAQTQPDVSQDQPISGPAVVQPTPPSTTIAPRPTVTGDLSSTKSVSLKGWSKPQLRDEVLRLRRLLASQSQPHPHAQSLLDASGSTDAHADANIDPTLLTASSSDIGPSTPAPFDLAQNSNSYAPARDTDSAGASGSATGEGESKPEQRRKRKAKDEVVRDGETGKRVERSRRTELGKALRNKASPVFCSHGPLRDDVENEI